MDKIIIDISNNDKAYNILNSLKLGQLTLNNKVN